MPSFFFCAFFFPSCRSAQTFSDKTRQVEGMLVGPPLSEFQIGKASFVQCTVQHTLLFIPLFLHHFLPFPFLCPLIIPQSSLSPSSASPISSSSPSFSLGLSCCIYGKNKTLDYVHLIVVQGSVGKPHTSSHGAHRPNNF